MNNFYNEPPFAKRLLELSKQEKVPETAQEQYVTAVVACFIGNSYGFSWAAIPSCAEMIKQFSPREIAIMVRLPKTDSLIKGRLGATECRTRFIEAIKIIEPASVPSPAKADYEALLKGKV